VILETEALFLQLLEPVYDRLARYCLAITRDQHEGEDLVSDSVLAALESFESITDHAHFSSYLFTVATRLHKRKRYRERFRRDYDEQSAIQRPNTDPLPDQAAEIRIALDAVSQLPIKMRQTVMLFEVADLTLEEIREVQGGTLSGVKSRLRRGREILQSMLESKTDEVYETKRKKKLEPKTLQMQIVKDYAA
jgi:RNA polymerase sigma-70 factor (ECF subfamily)